MRRFASDNNKADMDYSILIKEGLKKNKISIVKASSWLNITRQGFYKKLTSGNFFVHEMDILIEKGVLSKRTKQKKGFAVGQQVECTLKDAVWTDNNNVAISGPAYKEVCTITDVDKNGDILLKEYPINEGFWAGAFKLKK